MIKKTLLAKKDHLKKIIEEYPIPMLITSKTGGIEYFNNKFTESYGYTINDISTTEQWWNAAYPDKEYRTLVRQEWGKAIEESVATGKEVEAHSWDIRCKDGSVRHVEFDARLIDGGSVVTLNDITDSTHTENALRDSEEQFKSIIDQAPYSIEIHNMDGLLIKVNKAWMELWDIDAPDDLIGKYNILNDPQIIKLGYDKSIKEALTGKIITLPETVYDPKESNNPGRKRIVSTKIYPLRDRNNNINHFAITHNDITNRKEAKKDSYTIAAKWQSTFDAMSNSVCIIDDDGMILEYNSATLEMFGISEEEIKHKHCWEIVHNLSNPIENCPILRVQNSKQREATVFRKDDRWLEVAVDPIFDRNGEITSFVHVVTDVTEKNKAEEDLRQAQKMDSVGRLAGGIAHDFNNMLGVILGYTEIAIKDIDPTIPLYTQLTTIHNAAKRSAELTKQLLSFASKQTISPKVIDLNDAVECMLRVLQQLVGENIKLDWSPGTEIWEIRMDPAQISQILANLCINAKDTIPDVGKIIIETRNIVLDNTYCVNHADCTPGEYILLTVTDNGSGMNKEIVDHIFEPFFNTKELSNGNGLGLPATYGIIKQNNGFITAQSELGQGTTIEIYIPHHIATTDTVPKEHNIDAEKRGHETILLVEDEPSILKVTTAMLKNKGYTVLVAPLPEEAIMLAQKHGSDIDLLLTDVIMPEMNGRDLADKILPLIPELKCLFMSGYTADMIAQHGVLDKETNFIQKPFLSKPLYKKIREILD